MIKNTNRLNNQYMSKYRIVNLIDKIFISVAIFLIIYAWINFYIRNLWTTFFLSLIFTFAVLFILFYFTEKKQNKLSLNKKNVDDMNKYFLAFRLSAKTKKIELLEKILSKTTKTQVQNEKLYFFSKDKKNLAILSTHIDKMTQSNLIELLDQNYEEDVDDFYIFCNEINPNVNTKIFTNKTIHLIDKQTLYKDYFLKYNIFPDDSNLAKGITKLKFIDILKGMFTPNKARSYFFCGLILIFSSIILPYHIYYLIFGSMLLLFSIICKILPKFKNDK